jgi:hypothetical protein
MPDREEIPTRSSAWTARAKHPNGWVTVGFVAVAIVASGGLTMSAFIRTDYTAGGIERTYHALLASIVAGLVGGTLAWLFRRRPGRRSAIILTVFLAVGLGSGFLLGRWIAFGITRCVDGTGIRTGCGTPWFETFMKPKYAGGAYAGLGGIIALSVGLVVLGLLAGRKRRRAGSSRT